MSAEWNPEEVGSIGWNKQKDGSWQSLDVSQEDGTFIETVHVSDYEKLLDLYRNAKFERDHLLAVRQIERERLDTKAQE
jgi:hypothetical protein